MAGHHDFSAAAGAADFKIRADAQHFKHVCPAAHAWRNALLPVITVLIGWFISIFSGSLIIEQMFALNGMGQLYYQGLMNNDFELALAIQMFYVLIALVGQLITDLSYGIVDPRVRVNK